MCVDRAGLVGADGETHQGLYDMAFFRIIPNLIIMSPKNFLELEEMMEFSVSLKKPVIIRYPRGGESTISMNVSPIRYGKAEVLKKGSDVTVLTIGNTVSKGMGIASLFDQKNVSCEVISCRFIKPFDTTTVLKSIKKTKRIVVIEDGTILGGLSTIVKELLIEYSLMNLETYFYAYPDSFIKHGSIMDLEKKYHLDEESIYRDLEKKLLKK